jgi:hypothetical protein
MEADRPLFISENTPGDMRSQLIINCMCLAQMDFDVSMRWILVVSSTINSRILPGNGTRGQTLKRSSIDTERSCLILRLFRRLMWVVTSTLGCTVIGEGLGASEWIQNYLHAPQPHIRYVSSTKIASRFHHE